MPRMQSSSALRLPTGNLKAGRPTPPRPPQSQDHRLLDRHRVPLPADELRRVRGTAPAAGAGGVHPPGFPDYFREEPSWAKLPGVGLILAPVTARLHEWAYASEPLTAHRRLFTSKECEEAATLAMLSPLSRG